jgi:DNA-binding transcriptional ArsR family regulator
MIDAMAARLKALGHPQRLRLYELIRSDRYCCYVAGDEEEGRVGLGSPVGDLAQEFKLAPSTVSHHLKELRTAGLIEVERRGTFLFCRALEEPIDAIVRFLSARSAPIEFRPPGKSSAAKPRSKEKTET